MNINRKLFVNNSRILVHDVIIDFYVSIYNYDIFNKLLTNQNIQNTLLRFDCFKINMFRGIENPELFSLMHN